MTKQLRLQIKEATVDAEAQHDAEQQVAVAHAEASQTSYFERFIGSESENDSTASGATKTT